MDGDRFDGLAKSLAAGATRRRVLRGIGGGIAGLLGVAGAEQALAAACKRPNVKCGKGKNAECCQPPANGSAICVNDACGAACNPGFCPSGGQCVENTSTSGCGTSCEVCQAPPNATAYCDRDSGTCRWFCNVGFIDCGGVCTDFNNDAGNCGICGNVCASVNGTGACIEGGCVLTCNAGFMSCDGNPATGCETNVANDPTHCGFCGTTCGAGQGCADGTCTRFGCDGTSCQTACPGSPGCTCGSAFEGFPVCFSSQHGCAGHFCAGDGDCVADYGADSTCIFGFCTTPHLYCTSDAECGSGFVCVNKNGGCGGCDNYTGGTRGICNPICGG